jgi:hypothetical protein
MANAAPPAQVNPAPEPRGPGRALVGMFLVAAKVLMAFAAVLAALIVVVGTAALLVSWTAAAVRYTVPLEAAEASGPSEQGSIWQQLVLFFHRVAPPGVPVRPGLDPQQAGWLAASVAAREAAAAGSDDTPLREFGDRCMRVAAPSDAVPPARAFSSVAFDLQTLGSALYWERLTAAGRIEDSSARLRLLTWAGILIGLITTVLVGLRASTLADGKGFWPSTITVLAIAFPAIGTAVAAMLAFESPREEIARSAQQLASLRRVHTQIATEVRALPCQNAEQVVKAVTTAYPQWVRLYQEAQAAALAATAAAVTQSGGTPGAAPSVPQQAPAPPGAERPASP